LLKLEKSKPAEQGKKKTIVAFFHAASHIFELIVAIEYSEHFLENAPMPVDKPAWAPDQPVKDTSGHPQSIRDTDPVIPSHHG
jgi:hypothetical protein